MMKNFWSAHKRLHLWALSLTGFLLLFFALRGNRRAMELLCDRFTTPLKRTLARLCSHVPFSVAEAFYVLAVLAIAVYALRSVFAVVRSRHRARELYTRCAVPLCAAATVYALFCLLWGANYCTESFCERSGLMPQPVSAEELQRVTEYFADGVNGAANTVRRDADGVFAEPREDILACADTLYTPLYGEFPFLCMDDLPPKGIYFSRIMSLLGFTGFYFPFTGESNLNMDFPAASLGATMAHELAHCRGIASEQECNFLGILAAIRNDSAACRYSGWLTGYIYLSNALYSADPARYAQISQTLAEGVLRDLAASRKYWTQFEGPVEKVTNTVYNGFLKGYGDELGVKSYGACVDLLVLYFQDSAAKNEYAH